MRFAYVRCLMLGASLFLSSAHAARVSSSVFCQAILATGQVKDDVNPLTSLRDIQYRLSKLPFAKPPNGISPYYNIDLKLDLSNYRRRPFQKLDMQAAVARLKQLEEHAGQVNFDGTYVGYELRGYESISQARAKVVEEIERYEPQVRAELKKRYPYLRNSNLIQHGMSAYLLSTIFYLLHSPDYQGAALLMTPMSLMTVGIIEFVLPYMRKTGFSVDFDAQLRTIDTVLAHPGAGAPLHMISGYSEIRTELHKIFMSNPARSLNEDEVRFLVDAVEKLHEKFGDSQWISRDWRERTRGLSNQQKFDLLIEEAVNSAKHFPEGRTRQTYFDSIFYFDTETKEPVWLMFYRAFKTRPIPPKPPKKVERPQARPVTEESWFPGLRPQAVPAR